MIAAIATYVHSIDPILQDGVNSHERAAAAE